MYSKTWVTVTVVLCVVFAVLAFPIFIRGEGPDCRDRVYSHWFRRHLVRVFRPSVGVLTTGVLESQA